MLKENINKSQELAIVARQSFKEREYWLKKLSRGLLKSSFPRYFKRTGTELNLEGQLKSMETLEFECPMDITSKLLKLSNKSDRRLYLILISGLIVLLDKYTGNRDIIIGMPVEKQETEGEFINTVLAVRNRLQENSTFKEFLLQTRKTVFEAIENQNYPVEMLLYDLGLDPDEKEFPLFDVAILLENIHEKKFLTRFSLNMIFVFNRKDNHLTGCVEYNRLFYEKAFVKGIIRHLITFLETVLEDVNAPVDEICMLTEKEKEQLLYTFNNRNRLPSAANDSKDSKGKTIPELFEKVVESNADRIALIYEETQLSYKKLNEKVNRFAHFLREKGVKTGAFVGMLVERSIEMIVGMLGILKAGGAYLPIDPGYPKERLEYIINDSGIILLVSNNNQAEKINLKGEFSSLDPGNNYTGECTNPRIINNANNRAYVIYTSGSTGKPKGVVIEHRSIVNTLLWRKEYYKFNQEDVVLQIPSYSFDSSVEDIFTPLIGGAKLVLLKKENSFAMNYLSQIIGKHLVTHFLIVPNLYKTFLREIPGFLKNLKKITAAGEHFTGALVKEHFDKLNHVKLYNEYGPTENSVCTTVYEFCPERTAVLIGNPIDNVNCFILDKKLHLAPIGVPGELCISGEGLAGGYLNRPELTEEKFVTNPFEPGKRLYLTGDMARYLEDGNLEFLDRMDNQVKIRGYRIELGEIENVLLQHHLVKETVVTAREDETGDKYLCAYIVGKDKTTPEETPGARKLREYLSLKLPNYMVPSHFVNMEKLPLNDHGKIDRKALPSPGETTLQDNIKYVPPGNRIEKKLVEIWQKVLGRDRIGINENFFMIGGDSIKSIQIISRMNTAGYKLEMTDLFQYPSIASLAHKVKKVENVSIQSTVTGTVPLTPVQEKFFIADRSNPHHFNQAVMFYSPKEFNEEAFKRVFEKIHQHHDALRMTYKREEDGKITQINHGLDYPFSLQVFDLRGCESAAAALETRASQIQETIDLENGPLMKLGLFLLDDSNRLLIVVHHLVIDGISWRILFEDIGNLLHQYKNGEALNLPAKTCPFKRWAEKLGDYANCRPFLKEKTYWAELESAEVPQIEKDYAEPGNYIKDIDSPSFSLSQEESEKLLTKVNEAFGTQINDILLTALGMGFKKTYGHNRVLLALEGHGREKIIEGVDIDRTVGWFTSMYPVVLNISYENDPGRQVKEIKEMLRKVPNNGVGYWILKYLTRENHKNEIDFKSNPQVSFNYLGQFDTDIGQMPFEIAKESPGKTMSPEDKREFELDVTGMTANNRLTMTIAYSKKQYKSKTIAALFDNFQLELKRLLVYCLERKARELTPCDFTYKGLSIETVDRLNSRYNIEDLYLLTPMQEGMLFHTLFDSSSTAYFEQTSYRLHGELDPAVVEDSLKEVFIRHDILRTAFVHEGLDQPLQIVLKDRQIDFYYEDISRFPSPGEKERYIESFKEKDRLRGFDLSKDVLMRAAILQVDRCEFEVIWSFHHILMDGWCVGILNSEFLEIYNSRLSNREYRLPDVIPFRTYIQWLGKQDKEASKHYWKQYLDLHEEVAVIPGMKAREYDAKTANREKEYKLQDFQLKLDRQRTDLLGKIARTNHVTLNILVQAVWGIVLGKYNNRKDVVFGSVVSGRPFELEGVESMVGLFINTIPVRVRSEETQTFNKLLRQLQDEAITSEKYHYYPLAEIQALTPLKQELIDHIYIFENYPIAEQLEGYELTRDNDQKNQSGSSLTLSDIKVFEQTNYNFNLIILPGDQLVIRFDYNSNIYDCTDIERISGHLEMIFAQVIVNEKVEIKELTILTDKEKKQILYDFNNTEAGYPRDRTIHELFTAQAARTPDNTAVVGPVQVKYRTYMTYISYRELNQISDQLAYVLKEKGLSVDTIVGIVMERSIEMIVGILGILKAGGAYLPIDQEYPEERKNYMLKDSNAAILLTHKDITPSPSTLTSTSTCQVSPANLAYVIYTSGSTGLPKGVAVEHSQLVNFVYHMYNRYDRDVDFHDRCLGLTNIMFDVSVWEFFLPLSFGAGLILLPEQQRFDVFAQTAAIVREAITLIYLPPALLEDVCKQLTAQCSRVGLNKMLVGVEPIRDHVLEGYMQLNPGMKIINGYGPTETTICATSYNYTSGEPQGEIVPIGRPLSNNRVFLLDAVGHIVPQGIPGEICVSGAGVSRGYINNPELTAELFIYKSFPGGREERIYRTGDLAKWLPDGNIRFIGRRDQQVKIRGYRVELGEIENRLSKLDGIKEAIVVIQSNDQSHDQPDKYLCAYIVSHSETQFEKSRLREYLAENLPEYMIPSYFIKLDKIPLTANGKIDRKALPEPWAGDLAGNTDYIAPGNRIEKVLVEIWQKVLGRDIIGINDDFFEIGGDSIKTIQIISRMKQAGYMLKMQDIFQNPRITQLAPLVTRLERIAHQSAVTGKVPLTPIQKWFFENMTMDRWHFNQAIMLHSEERFGEEAIKVVFSRLQAHHDALRMTYAADNGEVIQTNHGPDYPLSYQAYDLRDLDLEDAEPEIEKKANEIQASIDLEKGPLMKLGLFRLRHRDRLLIAIHHLVIDGVSWRILIEDMETLLRQYKKGQPLHLPMKTDSFKLWSEKLSRYAAGQLFLKEKNHWKEMAAGETEAIEKDFHDETNQVKDAVNISFHLSTEETGLLLTRVNDAFNTEINDILLTALGLSVKRTFGNNRLCVIMEGHGREEILEEIDISRTVGWFTSMYPVVVDISCADNLNRLIKETKESLRKTPRKGIGYGILKYLTPAEYKEDMDTNINPRLSFNYLGQFGADIENTSFKVTTGGYGSTRSLEGKRTAEIEVSGIIAAKQLVLDITYNKRHYKPETMEKFLAHYQKGLSETISYCLTREGKELTPGDLTYPHLSIDRLEELAGQYPLEDIYPLSPMQEGKLFYAIYHTAAPGGFIQMRTLISGKLNLSLFETSINEVFKRYDILRAAFVYEHVDIPLQIILKERRVDFIYLDVREKIIKEDKQRVIDEIARRDRIRSFDLGKNVLLRTAILQTGDSEYEVVWSFHHILMDGWCLGILFAEFLEIYNHREKNKPYRLPPVTPYREYIRWYMRQDKQQQDAYWEKYLQGFNRETGLPKNKEIKKDQKGYRFERHYFNLSEEKTSMLHLLATASRVTLNTVVQAIWGILLSSYNREEDVVFGAVVSGRPSEIPGVESMVGLFINTIPIRISLKRGMTFAQLIRRIQENAIESEPYHSYPLSGIQAGTTLKRNLLDHVLVFENYPLVRQVEGIAGRSQQQTFEVLEVAEFAQPDYDLHVVILPGNSLGLEFRFNALVYDREVVEQTAVHIEKIVDTILADRDVRLEDIRISDEIAKEEFSHQSNYTVDFGF